jgi:hypothetical protein
VLLETEENNLNKGLIATLFGVVAVALIAAGCGSSSDDSTSSLTKAEFVSQADAICKKGNTEVETEFEDFTKENGLENKKPTEAQEIELAETILTPNVKDQSEELRALEAPSGDEDEITAMLDSLDEGVEEAEADPQALLSGKSEPFKPASKLAKEYGLTECGQE